MRSGKLWRVRQCPLPCGLPGSVYIDDQPWLSLPIPDAAWRGGEWRSSDQIFLKHSAQRFHGWLIQGRQKTAERRAMGETLTTKQRHESARKRHESRVKGFECGFSGEDVADEDGDKVNDVIRSEAWTSKADSFLDVCVPAKMNKCAS